MKVKHSKDHHCVCSNGSKLCKPQGVSKNSNKRDGSVRTGIESGILGWLIPADDRWGESGLWPFYKGCPKQLWERDVKILGDPHGLPSRKPQASFSCPVWRLLLSFHVTGGPCSWFSIDPESLEMGWTSRFPLFLWLLPYHYHPQTLFLFRILLITAEKQAGNTMGSYVVDINSEVPQSLSWVYRELFYGRSWCSWQDRSSAGIKARLHSSPKGKSKPESNNTMSNGNSDVSKINECNLRIKGTQKTSPTQCVPLTTREVSWGYRW